MSKKKISDTRVVATSMIVSLSDVSLNLIVGLITGSQAVLAQSLQGLSDLVTAIILYAGVVRSKRKPDRKHPLGYGREIFFWVLIASMFMFVGTGGVSLYLGIRQIVDPGEIENVGLALGMLSFGLVTNFYAFSKSFQRMQAQSGRRKLHKYMLDSGLVETKATFMIDFLGTISAIFGLIALGLFVITGNAQFDGIGGALVGLSMMIASAVLVLDVKSLIVGRAASQSVHQKIRKLALDNTYVEEVLDLRTLYLGSSNLLVLIEVHLNDTLTTNHIEEVLDTIKHDIQKHVPHVYHIQVEVETPDEEVKLKKKKVRRGKK